MCHAVAAVIYWCNYGSYGCGVIRGMEEKQCLDEIQKFPRILETSHSVRPLK